LGNNLERFGPSKATLVVCLNKPRRRIGWFKLKHFAAFLSAITTSNVIIGIGIATIC